MNATYQRTLGRNSAEEIFRRKICRGRWYGNKQLSQTAKELEGKYTTFRSFNIGDKVLVKEKLKPRTKTEKIHDQRYLLQKNYGKTIQRNVEKMGTFLKEWAYKE